jgi:hypothetical protein
MTTIYGFLAWVNDNLVLWFGSIPPEQKVVLSLAGTGIALTGYCWTIYKTYRGRSAPNPMSWFGFGGLTGVGALVQHEMGAGIGALTMDVTALACIVQGGASVLWKEGGWHWSDFKVEDWCALTAGTACFAVFMLSNCLSLTPLVSAAFATIADFFLYAPAIRSSWTFPRGENAFGYSMQSAKNLPAIASLPSFSPASWIYPMMLLWMNAAMIVYFLSRRLFVSREQEERSKAEAVRLRADRARSQSAAFV